MRITAYLHTSKETMYDLGKKNGLVGDALDNFMYALYEITVELEVDPKTGIGTIMKINDDVIMRP